MLSSGQKKPVLLSAAKTIYQATIMNLDEPLEIKVKREGWGYLVGRIKSDGTFLSLHKNTFQAEDFEDGTLTIYADMKTNSEGWRYRPSDHSDCLSDSADRGCL